MALTGGTLWGCSGVMGSYLYTHNGFDAKLLVTARLLFGGLITLMILFAHSGGTAFDVFRDRRSGMHEIMFAFLGMLPTQLVYFIAIQLSNPSTATVLEASAPIIVLLFYLVVDRRVPAKIEVFVLCIVLVGVFLITTHGDIGSLAITVPALIAGIGSAVFAAVYNIMPIKLLDEFGSGAITGWAMLIAGIGLCPFSHFWDAPIHMDTKGWLCLIGVVIFGTVVAQGAYLEGVRILGAVQGSLFETIEPVVAAFLTVVALGVTLTMADFVGTAMILLGIILLSLFGHTRTS